MAFREAVANVLHAVGNVLNPSGERQLALSVPPDNFLPVNEPGATRSMRPGTWYRTVSERYEETGMLWYCKCGHVNFWPFGKADLRRKLELTHFCSARCASVTWDETKPGEEPRLHQVMHTEKDADGNVIPVGRPYSLLEILPEQGKKMSEQERDKFYAMLPTWRIGRPMSHSAPFVEVFNQDCETEFNGHNAKVYKKALAENNPDPFGLMGGFGGTGGWRE